MGIFKEAYARVFKKRQIKVLEQRMESLIKSTVDTKIRLHRSENEEWAFDLETNTICYPTKGPKNVDILTEKEIIGFLLHEIAHARYTKLNYKTDLDLPTPEELAIFAINVIEDIRVEKLLTERYPGTYDSFKKFKEELLEGIGILKMKMLPAHLNFLVNVRLVEYKERTFFNSEKVEECYEKTKDALDRCFEAITTKEMADILFRDIWPSFKTLIEDPEDDGKGESGESKDDKSGKGGKGKGSKESKDKDKKEPKGDKDDASDEPKDDSKKPSKKDKEEMKEKLEKLKEVNGPLLDMEDLFDSLRKDSPTRPKKSGGKPFTKEIEDALKAKDKKEEFESDRETAKAKIKPEDGSYGLRTYEELYAEIEPYISYFARRLKSIMDDNQLKRFGGSFRTGKLNSKHLYKVRCNSVKVFSKPIRRLHRAYSVSLLVDESGSMNGNRIDGAAKTAVLLSEVLNRAGIPFEISGFNGSNRLYKKYEDKFNWTVKRNMENILPECLTEDAGDNNDAFSINWCAHRLQQREGEKILIVLSDGRPVNGSSLIPIKDRKRLPTTLYYYNAFDLKTEVIKAMNNNIVLIGIGIDYTGIENYYPQHIICNDISKLSKEVLNKLKRNIKRG